MRTKTLRLAVMSITIGALTVMTAGTALAAPGGGQGPGAPAANGGLGAAITNVMEHAMVWGTHNAVCTVTGHNPATDMTDPNC